MRGLFCFVLMALLAVAVFAEGSSEGVEITLLASYAEDSPEAKAVAEWDAAHPDATVTVLALDLSDGSTITMDALLAAGNAPNVYDDYIGRVSKYLVPEFAYPLNDVVSGYLPGVLDPYTRDGQILGVPRPGGAQGMAVNMEIMDDIGFTPTWDWTLDDFLQMCALVEQRYEGEKWGTGMFAGNQSGDYLINNWFAAVGAEYYANGYATTSIAETGGARVYELFQHMVREGYVPPNSDTLVDDDYVLFWARGELAATAFFPNWIEPYFNVVADQGYETFDFQFFPFPSHDGNGTPTYVSSAAIVVHKTGDDEVDALAADLAEYINSDAVQTEMSTRLVIPNKTGATFLPDSPRVAETAQIVADFGIMDVGLTTPFFTPRRPLHFPILQRVLRLELSPEDAITEYAAALNSVD